MAFNRATVQTAASQNNSWKAHGFINCYLPSRIGGRKKLGSLPLRKANAAEFQLATWLAEDAANIDKVSDNLIVEYNAPDLDETDFALGSDAAAEKAAREAEAPANQAKGYLNFYLPTQNGERKKLGSIVLHRNNQSHMRLALWLEESPEAHLTRLVDALELSYNSAEAGAKAMFALE